MIMEMKNLGEQTSYIIQDGMRHSSFTAFQTRSIIQELLNVQRTHQTIWKATIASDRLRMLKNKWQAWPTFRFLDKRVMFKGRCCKMIPKESLHCRNTQLIKVKRQDAAMDGYNVVALVTLVGIPLHH